MLGLASYLGTIVFAYRYLPPNDKIAAMGMATLSLFLASLALTAHFRLWKTLLPCIAWRHGTGLLLPLSVAISAPLVHFQYH